ncbi:MAG: PKD domain-containing protein [Bacteroidales bacterium]|jgi:PKD repeat protein|nr:PKD domain-containing protein [Bacteroidales bacterium]
MKRFFYLIAISAAVIFSQSCKKAPQPTASFIVHGDGGEAPCLVSFENTSTDADYYEWNFGDESEVSKEKSPTHTYTKGGAYMVKLFVRGEGGNNEVSKQVLVKEARLMPPTTDFTFSPNGGQAPISIEFTNTSTGATSYYWDFGDGSNSTAIHPAHEYTAAGNYQVILECTNAEGKTTKTKSISITSPAPPIANFTFTPNTGIYPCTVTFTNTSTNATSYTWNFGDGSSEINTDEMTTTHIFNLAGNFTITLTAKNTYSENVKTKNIIITAPVVIPPPIADFEYTGATGYTPCTVTFINTSSNADSYYWDFGDGATSSDASPTHIYTTGGEKTVTLSATNTGGTTTKMKVINSITAAPTKVRITKLTATLPTTGPDGGTWDSGISPYTNPDVFCEISTGGTILETTSTISDVASYPIQWVINIPAFAISNVNYVFHFWDYDPAIPLIDPDGSDDMGQIMLKFSDYTSGSNPYPIHISKTSGEITITLDVEWLP